MRLRTLPVSVAGVLAGIAMAVAAGHFSTVTAAACFVFAVLAQIASNFANEYYDYVGGLDRRGREGPRRGVTEGDITPRAMLMATVVVLLLACAVGLVIASIGGWWLIAIGIAVALGVFAYSAGPYPLSHHALGEVAVVVFFGVVPVNFTYYVMAGGFSWPTAMMSIAVGLMGANVLIVNNYRDYDDDRAVNKNTLAVVAGRRFAAGLYLFCGLAAALIIATVFAGAFGEVTAAALVKYPVFAIAAAYTAAHVKLWRMLLARDGASLNPLLGKTSILMAVTALSILITVFLSQLF